MPQRKRLGRRLRDHFHAFRARFHSTSCHWTLRFSTLCFSTLCFFWTACDFIPRPGDTSGDQRAAQWVTSGRLVADADPRLTILRLRIDTIPHGHDVLLTRFEFNSEPGIGDAYALSVGLDFGHLRERQVRTPYPLGVPGGVGAVATITCLCRPLRPDSVRGTYWISQRGIAQLTGRIDATLYFTAWDDTAYHRSYRLRQRIEGLR